MNVLQVNNFKIRNKFKKMNIIDNLSFDVLQGEIVQVKGRNGTGKSTLLKTLVRDETRKFISDGLVRFNNYLNILDLKGKPLFEYRSKIGYVPQNDDYSGHFNLTVKDVLLDSIKAFSGEKTNIHVVEDILSKFESMNSKQTYNFNLLSKPSKLSGGQQRLLTILSNIICRPGAALYIIDEPFNSIDATNKPLISDLFKDFIKKYPKSSFLVVSHDEEFNYATKIINL